MEHTEEKHHDVGFRMYFFVWFALVLLTGVTVGASYLNLRQMAIFTALLIATVKVSLVLLYFMHLRFEKPMYSYMLLTALGTYGIFIGLTFSDYLYR